MKHLRLSLVGFGVVGQGFAELLAAKHAFLKQHYEVDMKLAGVANARNGFICYEDGLHIPTPLELIAMQRPLTEYQAVAHSDSALAGLQATRPDLLVEATPTNLRDPE